MRLIILIDFLVELGQSVINENHTFDHIYLLSDSYLNYAISLHRRLYDYLEKQYNS